MATDTHLNQRSDDREGIDLPHSAQTPPATKQDPAAKAFFNSLLVQTEL